METNQLYKEFDDLITFIKLEGVRKGRKETFRTISKKLGYNIAFVSQMYSSPDKIRQEHIDLLKKVYKIETPVTVTVKQATGIIANKSIENQAMLSVLLDLVCEVLAHGKNMPSSAVLDTAKRMVDDRIKALMEKEQ